MPSHARARRRSTARPIQRTPAAAALVNGPQPEAVTEDTPTLDAIDAHTAQAGTPDWAADPDDAAATPNPAATSAAHASAAPPTAAPPSAPSTAAPSSSGASRTTSGQAPASAAATTATASPGTIEAFVEHFNTEFASILHCFGAQPPATTSRRPNLEAASGEAVPAETLAGLFTSNQRAQLMGFFQSHRIPDRLFNGDETGSATSHQRVMMSTHILSHGTHTPGSFTERVHARMCGHWVVLVNHYAGVSAAGGRGVNDQFDHDGNLMLGSGRRESVFSGTRMAEEDREGVGEHRARFQLSGLPANRFDTIQPGDWLWIYNDNGGAAGNHSVVFSRWASQDMTTAAPAPNADGSTQAGPGVTCTYRRAVCFSQFDPGRGGQQHTSLLGDHYVRGRQGQHQICTITRVSRVGPDAHPARTPEELLPLLGRGDVATQNQRFIERIQSRRHGRVNMSALLQAIRTRNAQSIRRLEQGHTDRVTDAQVELLRATNARDDVETLVRLCERLAVITHSADALGSGEQALDQRVEARHAANQGRLEEARAEIGPQIAAIDVEASDAEDQQHSIESHRDELEVAPELVAARRQRRRLRSQRRALRLQQRHARNDADRQAAQASLDNLAPQLTRIGDSISTLERSQRANRRELGQARRESRSLSTQIRRLESRRTRLQRRLQGIEASGGYHMAHSVSRGEFRGSAQARHTTGLLSRLEPAPDWGSLVQPSET